MNLEILTPEKKLFSADVYAVQLPGVGQATELTVAPWPKLSTGGRSTVWAVPHDPAGAGAATASGTPITVVATASRQASTETPASRPLIDLIQAPLRRWPQYRSAPSSWPDLLQT